MANKGINKVILVGNVGNDPKNMATPNGSAVCNFSLATTEEWRNKQTGEKDSRTEWHRITVFGKLGEIAAQYVQKGSQVYIEGKLRTRKWQDNDGKNNYTTEIIADEMQMLGWRGGNAGEFSAPVGGGSAARRNGAAPQPASSPAGGFDQFDDDIPF